MGEKYSAAGVYFIEQRLVQFVAAAQAEADDREGNGSDALEALIGIDPAGELAGELVVAAEKFASRLRVRSSAG